MSEHVCVNQDIEGIAELGGAAAIEMVASALADHGAHALKCANCGAPVIGVYCSVCGQEVNTHRRSAVRLLREVFREIASFDSRILRTAKALVLQPGELSRAFQEGRTRRYVPALRLYLFMSLIFFVVLSTTGIAIMQLELFAGTEKIVTDPDGKSYAVFSEEERVPIPYWKAKQPGPHYAVESKVHFFAPVGKYHTALPAAARKELEQDRLHAQQDMGNGTVPTWIRTHLYGTVDALETDPAAINGPLTKWIPRVLFLLLPLYALVLALFYWRQRKSYYFVDHLVFSMNTHSFVFLAILLGIALSQVVERERAGWLTFAAIGLYIFLGMKRFYHQGWLWTFAKFGGVSFVYMVFILAPALIVALVVSILGL